MVIRAAAPADWPELRSLWRRSVAATNDFVSRDDLDAIGRALIPCYFPAMQHIWLATDAAGRPLGFVGSRERSIEMLFLDPDVFRQGKIPHIAVDEQNERAFIKGEQFFQSALVAPKKTPIAVRAAIPFHADLLS